MDLNAKFCLQNRMNILFSLVSCKGIFKIILAYTILYLIISLNTFSESNTDSARYHGTKPDELGFFFKFRN